MPFPEALTSLFQPLPKADSRDNSPPPTAAAAQAGPRAEPAAAPRGPNPAPPAGKPTAAKIDPGLLPFPAFPAAGMFGPLVQLGLSTAAALMKAHSQMYASLVQQHPLGAALKQQNELMAELIRALDRHTDALGGKPGNGPR